jgi:hypothetical protein
MDERISQARRIVEKPAADASNRRWSGVMYYAGDLRKLETIGRGRQTIVR